MSRNPFQYVVYQATVGSAGYGLATAASDWDERGVYVPPTAWHWRLSKPPEQTGKIRGRSELIVYEVERFLELALKGGPAVLEVLWSPHYRVLAPAGERLRAVRGAFLSRAAADGYAGYADSQQKLVRKRLDDGKAWEKSALHLVRVLYAGLHLCRTGEVLVDVGELRTELAAIRDGQTPAAAALARAAELRAELAAALPKCELPAKPDVAAAEELLVSVRRAAV